MKKSRRLRRINDFIFYLSSKSFVLPRGTLDELVKCKTSKFYLTTKNSCQARHIRPPNWIPETLSGHVRPQIRHVRHLILFWVNQAYPVSRPDSKAFFRHVRPNSIPQRLSPRSNISGSQARFQRGWSDMSDPQPEHVWISDTPTARFSWGAIKCPHISLARLITHFIL
jgi:hypothetical protein